MTPTINILHLEDSERDSELIHSLIEGGGIANSYFLAENESDYLEILGSEKIDIILSDNSLPDYSGLEALRVARKKYPHIPFLYVTGTMVEDAAINAMLNGATDYVLKNKLSRLVPAIKRSLHESELEKQRKAAETALMESEKLLREAQKLAHLGVWTWKSEIDETTWTEELYEIAGLDPHLPAPGYAIHSSMYTPGSWLLLSAAVSRAMETGVPYELELEMIRPDGSIRNLIAFGARKVDTRDQVPELFGTVQDITERKRAERELITAKEKAEESDQLKTAFLQNMSHEIRTPLNSIIGFSDLLNQADITSEEIKTYTAIINHSGLRLIDIVTNVLTMARIQTGQVNFEHRNIELFTLISGLFDYFEPLARAKNIRLNCHHPENPPKSIFTDEDKLHQIFSNLINNALKFTKAGTIDFGYEIREKEVEFYVRDTGIGISREHYEKIFERFMQTDQATSRSYEGAGLGLAICKGLVELLGGKIRVDSEVGKGSTLYFTLPYTPEKAADSKV